MFTKNKDGESMTGFTPVQDTGRSAAGKSAPRTSGAASIICNDMEIKGSVISEGSLQIDGHVDGDVTASDITIGATGKVVGEVKAETVRIKGEVQGSIRARRVELETGARVEGDVLHASLSIQPNAIFEGQVKHSEDPLKNMTSRTAKSAQAKTPDKSSSEQSQDKTSSVTASEARAYDNSSPLVS